MEFWQAFEASAHERPRRQDVQAAMPDGSALGLPLRDCGTIGVTGLIANQASFAVARALAG